MQLSIGCIILICFLFINLLSSYALALTGPGGVTYYNNGTAGQGYLHDTTSDYVYSSGDVYYVNDAVISSCIDGTNPFDANLIDRIELIKIIKRYRSGLDKNGNNNCSDYYKLLNQNGANFIILSMINTRHPESNGGWATDDEVTKWESYVKNPNVTISHESISVSSGTINSAYSKGVLAKATYDDSYYIASHDTSYTGLVFKDENGRVVYRLKDNCGNPIGILSGLPVPKPEIKWTIQANISATYNNLNPGSTITWHHSITNSGSSEVATNKDVKYWSEHITDASPPTTTVWDSDITTQSSGLAIGGTSSEIQSVSTISQDDVGKRICKRTAATPSSYDTVVDQSWAVADKCVDIPYSWTLSPKSIARVNNTTKANYNDVLNKSLSDPATAKPGQIITWTHLVKNNGPTLTDNSIGYGYLSSGVFNSGYNQLAIISTGFLPTTTPYSVTSNYTASQDNVSDAQPLCRITQTFLLNPASNGPDSDTDCVQVPYNYELEPKINLTDGVVVESNTTHDIPTIVTNSGPTKSKNTSWQITQVIINPSKTKPNEGGGDSNQDPCGVYFKPASADGECSVIASGTNKVFDANGAQPDGTSYPPKDDNSISAVGVVIGDLEVGKKVCYALSVKDLSNSSNQWRHSSLKCMTIGKKPKVQIWGGDLWSGGKVQTSASTKSGKTFGSWIEYGIFTTGSITGAASGSAFAGSGLAGVDSACKYSFLSFANAPKGGTSCTGAAETIGNYSTSRVVLNVAASFPGGTPITTASTIVPSDLNSGTYTVDGDLTLSANTPLQGLQKNKSIIIKANGTVTISGDQVNSGGSYNNISELPQLVIIANSINITDSVANVDAWLVAKQINTCSTVAVGSNLTSGICDKKLIVNGPVIADKLYLRRTAGSGLGSAASLDGKEHSGDPAEIFNLRADAYLWAYGRASINNGAIRSVYSTELPVRM